MGDVTKEGGTKMKAVLIISVSNKSDAYRKLAETYNRTGLEGVIRSAARHHKDALVQPPLAAEVRGEVQEQTARHILTWEDGMNQTVRIYRI